MKKLNLNSIVRVKLTDYGKDIYYHRFNKLNVKLKQRGGQPILPRFPKADEYGFYQFQLWDFINIYGDYFRLGDPCSPLEDLNFYIEEQDLEEMCE